MYSSQGTINYPTLVHLVGHFRILYLDARNHACQVNYVWNGGCSVRLVNRANCQFRSVQLQTL